MKRKNVCIAGLLTVLCCFLFASCGKEGKAGPSKGASEESPAKEAEYLLVKEQHYDSEGRAGLYFLYEYDNNGYLIKTTEYSGSSAEYWLEYENDAQGRAVKETRCDKAGPGIYREFEYDEAGNMVLKQEYEKNGDPGAHWVYEYDSAGNMVKNTVISSTGKIYGITEYEYDGEGRLISNTEKDEDGKVLEAYTYEYRLNKDGLAEERISRDMGGSIYRVKQFEYDEDGNVTAETTFDGKNELLGKTEYAYTLYE